MNNESKISILSESLKMELRLSMEFDKNQTIYIPPVNYIASYSEYIPGIVDNKLYQRIEVSKNKTKAESSSWFYGYSEFKNSGTVWQVKSYLKSHDEPNPAVNYGFAIVNWEMLFVVKGPGVTYDGSLGWQPVSIVDLDVPAPAYLGTSGSLSDGHRYKVVMRSVLESNNVPNELVQSSELQIFNAAIHIAE